MRFAPHNALVRSYHLLNESKTTTNIPLLTIHCASNTPCVDAQAVRPYMPRSMQLVHSVHLFIYQLRGVDARAVRPYIAIMGVLRGNGYSACVPDAVG